MTGFKQQVNDAGKRGYSFALLNHYPGWLRLFGGILAKRLDCFCWRHMYFCGACFCMRKEMIEKSGMFDEKIFLYGEENDIHYRIHQTCPESHDRYMRKMIYLHPTENRALTVRECARLQSFPDSYDFCGGPYMVGHDNRNVQDKYEQIGDAVPPLLAYAWGITITDIFNKYKK